MRIQHYIIGLVMAGAALAQTKQIEINGNQVWTDTGIDLQAGDTVKIEATGKLQFLAQKENGPDGLGRRWMDMLKAYPVTDAGAGALIGRIGDRSSARPFLIGPRRESRAPAAGRLFLGINQLASEKPEGSFQVKVERVAAAVKAAMIVNVPKFPQELLDSIPRRVVDKEGTEGDRVNFIVIGSQEKVQAALKSAGWVVVDKTVKDTILRGALASFSKQAYVTIPMSELNLFGRSQDFGYAQADPVKVVAARHHFRVWKAPFTLEGQTVWAGAGTHDVGFDRDQRNNKVTHKIDPETDKERDYIGKTMEESGLVAKLDYMTVANPIKEAKTAHGQAFFSDGRTLLIYFQPDTDNKSIAFADLFCSVMKQNNPDGGEWGGCEQYIDAPGRTDLQLAAIPNKYRILIVPGFFSSCAGDSPAFQEGQQALKEKYGLTVELLGVPNDASEENAKKIAGYLREQMKKDSKKYIAFGYSKGTPDLQVALAKEKGVSDAIAAFVSVAGASGGSPIADVLPSQLDRWINQYKLGKCEGDAAAGFKSLAKAGRQAFLASYPHPIVPTYSLAAVSDRANTSKALLQMWQLLSAFGSQQDGQLAKDDAIIPEAKFLGTARADHFAVALPFDKSPDSTIRSQMDKTKYPRATLLEAMVRFVMQDLGQP